MCKISRFKIRKVSYFHNWRKPFSDLEGVAISNHPSPAAKKILK